MMFLKRKQIFRNTRVIALLLLVALAACHQPPKVPEPVEGPSPKLAAIDSLMWQQPDSALLALMAYEGDSSDYNRHYAQLLTSELLYKNDYAQTNRPELQQAVAYFDSLVRQVPPSPPLQRGSGEFKTHPDQTNQIAFLAARAHYINGVGYYENDSAVQACTEYLKALEIMEERFQNKELVGDRARFMALTYTRLTDLFSDLYLHEQAIYFGKKSMVYYYKYDASSRHVSRMLNEIGSHYDMMNRFDSANFYYRKSLMVLPDTNNLTYRDIATLLAYLSYKTGEVPKTSLNQLKRLLGQAETQKETLSRCAIVGEIYYQEKQFDSAWIYLNKVFYKSQSADSKKQVAERLVEICKSQGKEEEIIKYAGFLVPFATQYEDKGIVKSQLAELCNYYKQFELKQQHKEKVKKQTELSIALFTGLLVVMLVVFILYWKQKRKKQNLEIQIEEERHSHRMQQAAMAGRLKRSNAALKEQGETRTLIAPSLNEQKQEKAKSYADEPICQLIMERVNKGQFKSQMDCTLYKNYALEKNQLSTLREAADRHFNHFTSRLAQTYPSLTKGDLDYCCLYLLGLTDADISALMQRAYNTVSERSRKLKTIFDSEVALSTTIRSLANGFASV